LRPGDLAFERFAEQFLPLGLLVGSQNRLQLFVCCLAGRLELFASFGPIAAAASFTRERATQFALNAADLVLLFVGQVNRFGNFRVGERSGPSLLQGDLLESLELIGV
jgi:hypothetical protein